MELESINQYTFYEKALLYMFRQQVLAEDSLFAGALWRSPKIYTVQFMTPRIETESCCCETH